MKNIILTPEEERRNQEFRASLLQPGDVFRWAIPGDTDVLALVINQDWEGWNLECLIMEISRDESYHWKVGEEVKWALDVRKRNDLWI